MNNTAALLLILLGAKPVDLVSLFGEAGKFTPLVIKKCEPIAPNPRCQEGRIEYKNGRVSYDGDLPIDEALSVIVEQDRAFIARLKECAGSGQICGLSNYR